MSATPGFDRIARPYRLLEYLTLGRLLECTRFFFLPRLEEARNALVLGDGDGRFLACLLAANPNVEAAAVDLSAEMLRLLLKRCTPYQQRLRTQQIDALLFQPPAGSHYDLVVTHFFLDCLSQADLNRLIAHLAPALSPAALWLVSDFRIPSGTMRLPAHILVRTLYLAFRILTGLRITRLPDHSSSLTAAGFTRIDRKLFLAGTLTTELWQFQSKQ